MPSKWFRLSHDAIPHRCKRIVSHLTAPAPQEMLRMSGAAAAQPVTVLAFPSLLFLVPSVWKPYERFHPFIPSVHCEPVCPTRSCALYERALGAHSRPREISGIKTTAS